MLSWLTKLLSGENSEAMPEDDLLHQGRHVAAAALLVEAATLDADYSEKESATIKELLQTRLALNPVQVDTLLRRAEERHGATSDLHRFTHAVKHGFSAEERVGIIEMLWEVAYADGRLHEYEANLLRRITGLIYVTDREAGAARKRVLARLKLDL
jgi:uncharacterized tellurite resistance protein B-like protein